jgi:heme O synthase-like polyprenyltransferase
MKNGTLKKILMGLLVAFVILLTLKYVKMLPAVMKVLALAANVVTIYWAYTIFKSKKDKDEQTD